MSSAAWLYLWLPCSVSSLRRSTRFSRYSNATPHCFAVCPSKSSCTAMRGSCFGTHPRIAASTDRSSSATTNASAIASRFAALLRINRVSSAMRNASAMVSLCSVKAAASSGAGLPSGGKLKPAAVSPCRRLSACPEAPFNAPWIASTAALVLASAMPAASPSRAPTTRPQLSSVAPGVT